MDFLTKFSIVFLMVASEDFLSLNINDVTSTQIAEEKAPSSTVDGYTDVIYVDSLSEWARADISKDNCSSQQIEKRFESPIIQSLQENPTQNSKSLSIPSDIYDIESFQEDLKESIISELKEELKEDQRIELNSN